SLVLLCLPRLSIPLLSRFVFIFSCLSSLPYLHSFPTRRSSDLRSFLDPSVHGKYPEELIELLAEYNLIPAYESDDIAVIRDNTRSEEHTSELQSRFDLVCRLLLEKKNNGIEDHQPGA